MSVPENKSNGAAAVGSEALQNVARQGAQVALQEGEKAIAEKSDKAKNVVNKAQQAMQAAQVVQSVVAGLKGLSSKSTSHTTEAVSGSAASLPAGEDINSAIEASGITGIIHVTALKIVIDGNVFKHFESFQLQQSTVSHHAFRLVLQNDILATEQDHTMEDARNFLGSRISVTFTYKSVLNDSPEREFIGVITQVGFAQVQGSRGSIVLTGQSPTLLLDAAPHTQSFGGAQAVSLSSIVKDVIRQGIGETRFDVSVNPAYKSNLLYSSQYNESHHNYLSRMAAAYGEWYFYDGRILHFGKPAAPNPVKLIYGKDTEQVQLKMKAAHINRKHYGYNSSSHNRLHAGDTAPAGLGELGSFAGDTSKKIFTAPSLVMSPIRAVTDNDIEATQKSAAGAAAAGVFTLTGKTSVPFLYPGCLIEMNFRKPESTEVKYFSRLIVTEINHSLDARGNYQGYFEAIPSDVEYLPAPAYYMPAAQPQLATVKDNKDSKGRIRVQFDWQHGSDTTDFIRMMSPDAGGSDKVSTNRGFMAVPEEGDQVMVGFMHNHPDRPFAMGGMFHGKVGAGGGSGNNVKSLSSKSGHTVSLDDGGGITVVDKDKNVIHLDGAGNISVHSKLTINLSCGGDGNGPGAASIHLDNEGNIALSGKNITAVGSEVVSMGAGSGTKDSFSGSGFSLDPKNVSIGAEVKCSIGGKSSLEAGSPGTVTIQANGETSIKGSTVNIN